MNTLWESASNSLFTICLYTTYQNALTSDQIRPLMILEGRFHVPI